MKVILFRFSMAKKDKHNPGQSRNSSVFKVANYSGKFNKQKGKAKEVSIKLKKLQSKKSCRNELVQTLDDKMNHLRKTSVSLKGTHPKAKDSKVSPVDMLKDNTNGISTATVDSLADVMEDTNMKNIQT